MLADRAPPQHRLSMPSKIRCLASAIVACLLLRGLAFDPEHLLLEGTAVVEREHVELAVVTKSHVTVLLPSCEARGAPVICVAQGAIRSWDVSLVRVRCRRMKPNFTGPNYTIGVEEELMISTANPRTSQRDRVHAPKVSEGRIKPELMESVLEISTEPCPTDRDCGPAAEPAQAGARIGRKHELAIGSGGTHPFARWEDQRIVPQPRYRDLVPRFGSSRGRR